MAKFYQTVKICGSLFAIATIAQAGSLHGGPPGTLEIPTTWNPPNQLPATATENQYKGDSSYLDSQIPPAYSSYWVGANRRYNTLGGADPGSINAKLEAPETLLYKAEDLEAAGGKHGKKKKKKKKKGKGKGKKKHHGGSSSSSGGGGGSSSSSGGGGGSSSSSGGPSSSSSSGGGGGSSSSSGPSSSSSSSG